MKLADVRENYDRAARSYDRWNRLFFDKLMGIEALRERAVVRLEDVRGGRVLDLCCGTGLNLPWLQEAVGPQGEIVAVDYSEGMLDQARKRVREQGWDNVRLVQGDAARMETVEGPFDGIISTWALGIVDDLDGALARAMELLAEGGRFVVLDFHRTRPERGPLRWLTPLCHRILVATGVDTPEDLDQERLQRRWARGKAFLRRELEQVGDEPYFHDVGFLLSGRRPVAGP